MARKVRQMRGKGNHIGLVPAPSMAAPDLDTRIALIQALIPVALEKVHVELQADVERLAGERYVREGRRLGHVRWTVQRGSIYLADQKIPLAVPRVRDRLRNQEVPLPTYERLQAPRTLDAGLLHKVLGGLSTREYERCAEAVPEAFGLSASTVSRRFKRASARKLQELLERRLDRYDVVALLLDGKTFAEDEMVAAVGITITGEKVLLGFVQTATENRKVCAAFLRELVDRWLRTDLGLFVVTDGAKGLHAAVREVFGTAAQLQRCQWHKRENVLAYLPERHRPTLRRKLQAAYEQPTYEAAKRALGKVRAELVLLNASAVARAWTRAWRRRSPFITSAFSAPRRFPRAWHELENDQCARIDPRPCREPHRQGRSLEEQRAEAAVVGHRIARSRAAAAPHQELPSAALAACRIHATDRRNEEVGGVNQKVVTECQLRMALTPSVVSYRQVKILSAGIVRARYDSCDNAAARPARSAEKCVDLPVFGRSMTQRSRGG